MNITFQTPLEQCLNQVQHQNKTIYLVLTLIIILTLFLIWTVNMERRHKKVSKDVPTLQKRGNKK